MAKIARPESSPKRPGMELPNGTVTFLLTDIEGSTKLWERSPEAMRRALARHDALAEAAVGEHNGAVVKHRGEGDSLFCVFDRATDAAHAALALQLALTAETWPDEAALRVRVVVHTGDATAQGGDYFGPTVNRAARLRAIAHGGQTLVSGATYELARGALPVGASLRYLGRFRLKDLQEAEDVYQLDHPRLPAEFPPLPTLDVRPHNLPHQLTSFVGREREMEEVKQLLSETCLLTLTGTGGLGKTRLAVQVAAEVVDEYDHGVWLVPLAPLSDPALVPQAVASELGVREETDRPLARTLTDALRTRRLLLILDNCEHLLDACASLADSLLTACPGLRVLASSRAPLSIGGETVYRVMPLTLPRPGEPLPAPRLREYEATRLFLDRATAATPSFVLSDRSADGVARICRQLDGIPLAIELAAVRVKALPVEQIAARLDDRFRLLTGGSRTALPRQQTLRALFDWSYDLLSEAEKTLFQRLSVFSGGFTLEAAEAVCSGGHEGSIQENAEEAGTLQPALSTPLSPDDILDLLLQLVDKSLVVTGERDGVGRYRLLETLRQYAAEKLNEAGGAADGERRHTAYFLDVAQEADKKLRGSDQAWWLERLDLEHDNMRAALSRAARTDEDADTGLKLAGALWWFWNVRGYTTEGREMLAAKLDAAPRPTADRARALNGAAVLARNQGDYGAARALSEESLHIKRELGDRHGIAATLNNLATLALAQSDYATARPFYQESLEIERSVGDRQGITASLIGLATVALEQGDYAVALAQYEESLRIKRDLDDRRGIAASLAGVGSVTFAQGNLRRARALHTEALELRRTLMDRRGVATSLQQLGAVALAEGEGDEAVRLAGESLTLRRELGDRPGVAATRLLQAHIALVRGDLGTARAALADSLPAFAELLHRRSAADALELLADLLTRAAPPHYPADRAEDAARLVGAAHGIRAAIGAPLHPVEHAKHDVLTSAITDRLGAKRFTECHDEGASLTQERALAFALEHLHDTDA